MLCNAVPQRGYMSCSRYGTLGNTVPVMLAEQILWIAMLHNTAGDSKSPSFSTEIGRGDWLHAPFFLRHQAMNILYP